MAARRLRPPRETGPCFLELRFDFPPRAKRWSKVPSRVFPRSTVSLRSWHAGRPDVSGLPRPVWYPLPAREEPRFGYAPQPPRASPASDACPDGSRRGGVRARLDRGIPLRVRPLRDRRSRASPPRSLRPGSRPVRPRREQPGPRRRAGRPGRGPDRRSLRPEVNDRPHRGGLRPLRPALGHGERCRLARGRAARGRPRRGSHAGRPHVRGRDLARSAPGSWCPSCSSGSSPGS